MLNIKFIDQLLHVVYLLQIVTYSGPVEVSQCPEKTPINTKEYIKIIGPYAKKMLGMEKR